MLITAILRRSVYCFALAGGLFLTSPAGAQTVLSPGSGLQGQVLVASELKQIRKLLEMADHDYKGHRAAAVHEITKAIHIIEPPGMKKGLAKKGLGGGGKKNTGNNEDQATSDAQLAQAIKQLQAVKGQLGANPTGNVALVSASLTKAVEELETALKIK
jgi:hypothetical protein